MPSHDEAVDALFELPPEEFTAARDRLAKELGDRDAAGQVKTLRRPTVPAWAVNRAVRRHRDVFEQLLEAGREVRSAQRRAASGLAGRGFGTAIGERRRLVRELTERAVDVLEDAGRSSASHRGAIANTFEAAAAEDAAAEAVGAARLSKELTPPSGFEILGAFEVLEGAGEEAPAEERDPQVTRAEREMEKWRTRLATAREERRSIEREAQETAGRVTGLERDLARARREAEGAATRLERSAKKAEDAERRLEEAAQRLEELRERPTGAR